MGWRRAVRMPAATGTARGCRGFAGGRLVHGIAMGMLALTLGLVGAGLLGPPVAVQAQAETPPLVIDTDLGPDDLLALAWLVGRPGLDIRAITVTGTGRATCAAGLANLRALLAALEASGPEVACGSERPLGGGGTPMPAEWRARADALYGLALAPPPGTGLPEADTPGPIPASPGGSPASRSAEELLRALLAETTDHVAVLALGPLTTLGAVLDDPELAVRVASVTASLGALDVPGNVRPAGSAEPGAAEWNAHADPRAVQRILESGVPLTLVPLDVAERIALSDTLLGGLRAGGDTPAARLVAQLLAADPSLTDPDLGFRPLDVLAAVALVDRSVIETRERLLDVATSGADAGALHPVEDGLPAMVAVGVDRAAFELALLSGIRDDVPTLPSHPPGVLTIAAGPEGCSLDPGGVTSSGPVIVRGEAGDAHLIAVLAALSEGYGVADVEAFLSTAATGSEPPGWLLLSAYLEVEAGAVAEDTAELGPGDHVAMCITGDGDTAAYRVAPTVLTITDPPR